MNGLGKYLKEHDVRQEAFANLIGVSQAMVSKLAGARVVPSLAVAVKIERETGGAVPVNSWLPKAEAAE